MNDRIGTVIGFAAGAVIALFFGVLMFFAAVEMGEELANIRIEAVKRGAAKWEVDERGKTTFKWTQPIVSELEKK